MSTRRAERTPLVSKSPTSWFLRGFFVGSLLCGALDALSYFSRSDDWRNLISAPAGGYEALGFPLVVWEEGNTYGGYFADYSALVANLGFASLVGLGFGAATLVLRRRLDQIIDDLEIEAEKRAHEGLGNFQFSLRSVMVSTFVVAVLATLGRLTLAGRPETLGAIYLLGPIALVSIALAPRKIAWQQRVLVLVPAALLLILTAILVGTSLAQPLEFDRVLLGIFVCWTPQGALAAIAVTLIILLGHRIPKGRR